MGKSEKMFGAQVWQRSSLTQSVSIQQLSPSSSSSSSVCSTSRRFAPPSRRFPSRAFRGTLVGKRRCKPSDEGQESNSVSTTSFSEAEAEAGSSPFDFRKLLAPAGIALGAALFVLSRTSGGIASLEDLAQSSVPLDVALSNGRPSVVEFYADWCEVCKSLAKDSSVLKQRYGDRVNFVMLNVDNPKWAEEVAEYRVGGIPHWEYLDTRGNSKGFVVGNLPKEILDANAEALSEGGDQAALPYVRKVFASSPLQDPQASG